MVERTLELTQQQREYLNDFMNKVSRSFAFVVPCLGEPLSQYGGAAYLICRVADNIEDCKESLAWKKERFAEFTQLLSEPCLAPRILSVWDREPWPGLTPNERQLMGLPDGLTLWEIYALIPDKPRRIIGRWASVMAAGMLQIEDPQEAPRLVNRDGVQMLANETDYNRYCYFVAGTVGHMVTELVVHHHQLTDVVAGSLLANCEAFGRGLQKTNIVKDFAEDLGRGVCYLPDEWLRESDYSPLALRGAPEMWRRKVVKDVMDELGRATDYVSTLPYEATGLRQASLLCLLPAFQTILLAVQEQEKLFTAEHHVKISRQTLAQCVQDTQSMITDNDVLIHYHREVDRAIATAFNGLG
jgi:farnesyl-diphosphate farnesyltransferase